jgi:hypothetical protein
MAVLRGYDGDFLCSCSDHLCAGDRESTPFRKWIGALLSV